MTQILLFHNETIKACNTKSVFMSSISKKQRNKQTNSYHILKPSNDCITVCEYTTAFLLHYIWKMSYIDVSLVQGEVNQATCHISVTVAYIKASLSLPSDWRWVLFRMVLFVFVTKIANTGNN